MDWLNHLMRPDLRGLVDYNSARAELSSSASSRGSDANEFPWPPFGNVSGYGALNRYPEPQPTELRTRLGAVWNISADKILLGRGSDEGIDVLLRLFCRAGTDQILICPPTYDMYEVAAKVQGAQVIKVPLNAEWQLDVPAILKACTPHTKLIFIPSPNAPMGHLMHKQDIVSLCQARAEQSLIVIDEAYIEFCDTPDVMLSELNKYPNLAILRSLSRAHALAGERVGAVISSPEIIAHLRTISAPYPLPQSAIRAALDVLTPNGLIQNSERRKLLMSERARMTGLLPQSPLVTGIFPSVANFLLVQTKDSAAFMQHMRQLGISLRDHHDLVPDTVRLSIGMPEENNLVLKALGIEVTQTASSLTPRMFSKHRVTKESVIDITVNLDSPGFIHNDTGIGFLDHMLDQLASHGGFGLELHCKGDLHVDEHHSIEDIARALGECLLAAMGNKRGVMRMGAPLDESTAHVLLDLSGRPYCQFNANLTADKLGGMNSEMVPHFFHTFAMALHATLHITLEGQNTHHMVEACFKAVGRALRQALQRNDMLPLTKDVA